MAKKSIFSSIFILSDTWSGPNICWKSNDGNYIDSCSDNTVNCHHFTHYICRNFVYYRLAHAIYDAYIPAKPQLKITDDFIFI